MEGKVEDLRYLVLKCSFIVESKLEKHLLDLNAPLQISSRNVNLPNYPARKYKRKVLLIFLFLFKFQKEVIMTMYHSSLNPIGNV